MDEQYGAEGAALLRGRMADMRAADCLGDVPLLALFQSAGGLGSEVMMSIGTGLRMVLKANHLKPPKQANGEIDWSRVERVLVQRIEPTHA